MKALLVNPPTPEGKGFIREGRCTQEGGVWTTLWPPISLATIAAVLERDGHDVSAVDAAAAGYPRAQLLEWIGTERPDAVLWSTGTPSIATDLALAGEIVHVSPGTRTAVMGTHVTALDEPCLRQTPELDAIFRNEPEETASAWVRALEDIDSWSTIPGLSYRHGNRLVRNPDRPFIGDLDALPDPAWHLFDLDDYRLPLSGARFLMVTPHRGCPYLCSYCTAQTYYGAKLRRRSIARVVSELRRNRDVHGVDDIFFWSDTFTLDRRYVLELCEAIEPLGMRWASNSRVDTLDSELAAAMKRSGCWMVSFGIESGDQEVLDASGKAAKVDDAARAVAAAQSAGLKVAGHFVLGLPGETKQSLERTLALAAALPLDFEQFYCAVPFPGSRLYEQAMREGWIARESFDRFRQDEAILELPALTPADVMTYRRRAYRSFYTKPRTALGAVALLSPKNLGRTVTSVRRFFGWTNA